MQRMTQTITTTGTATNMANALYDKGRQAFGNAGINWSSDDIRAILIDTAQYTPDLATHDFLNDIPAGARVATVALAGKTNVDGVMDANDATFSGLSTPPTCEAVVIYKHTGTESTSALIAIFDTATGLPTPTNATAVTVEWSNGANKIFKL
jgi:hypothetical protein